MKKKAVKRGLAAVLISTMLISSLCGFTTYGGLGTAYYESKMDIFDGASYSEIISGHPSNGVQHAYYVTADTESGKIVPFVFNGEVRATYTVGDMVKYAEEQGYKVIAAINGDIYDTSSGTPKGLVIHGGNIVTSGYAPDRVIAFDSDGKAEMLPASLSYTLKGTIENTYEVQIPAEEQEKAEESGDVQTDIAETESSTTPEPEKKYETKTETKEEEWNGTIDFFNVPHGGANGLHLYNRHYSSSTKTTGTCAEVVIECKDIQLKVNGSIKGTVKSVNAATNNTAITDNTVVLSTVKGSATYDTLTKLKVGSEIEISVADKDNCGLEDVTECIGIYYSLVENGENVTATGSVNPRTAMGIKADGSIVMFELDGRQASVSKGLSLSALAYAMIDIGCETAVNLDGGGSSVIYVRQPGKDNSASRRSSPSGGSERRVANAVLLVYKDSASSKAEQLNVYPELSFVMPGASVQLTTYASNNLYEKVSGFNSSNVSYSVSSQYGTVTNNGLFTASDKAGTAEIKAKSGSMEGMTSVMIVDDITITPSVSKITVEAGEQRDINASASIGANGAKIDVNTNDSLFTWSCDENIGVIDNNGVFTATSSAVSSSTGNIYIEYNGAKVTIPVTVGAYKVEFTDTYGHWAKDYIGTLAGMKILDGIGDNMFNPDGSVTRAQFVAMLAKMTSEADVSAAANAGFTDVPSNEWYYGYVNWGYENGIVNGMGDGTFAPNANITREQMAVMLCNYSKSINFVLPQVKSEVTFSDTSLISSWAVDYVFTAAGAGIINGFDTGDFRPQGIATRAQAATVIYKMCEVRGIL